MDDLISVESKVRRHYADTLSPLAERTGFILPVSGNEAPGLPTVLFLGNHSSGKSTFINYLVRAPLQKTGLAPTDDGFTIITYAEQANEFDGQTAVTHRDLPFQKLQRLGPAFTSRLRLRTHPDELLKSVTLIDSPGMIDSASATSVRGYDFAAAVRHFAEHADLILFFFDPDKPGTTGETMHIFTETLSGLEHKLLIVLNKVDLFDNVRDLARTYGTLCWNLSRVIKTKDMPHIYNVYVPGAGNAGRPGGISLEDFDASREEVLAAIRRAPERRVDNLVSDLYQSGRRLAVHARVIYALAGRFRKLRYQLMAWPALMLLLTGLVAWLAWNAVTARTMAVIIGLGVLLATALWFFGRTYLRRYRERMTSPEVLDVVFAETHKRELALEDRADLRAFWASVKPQTKAALRGLGPEKISRAWTARKLLRRLEEVMDSEVPQMRRDVAAHLKVRRESVQPVVREGVRSEQ